jgi:hypothetical protein
MIGLAVVVPGFLGTPGFLALQFLGASSTSIEKPLERSSY